MNEQMRWSPVVILNGGISDGIQTGNQVILDLVSSEEEAWLVAKNACLSNPSAIACTVQHDACEGAA